MQRTRNRSLRQAFSSNLDLISALIDSISEQSARDRGPDSFFSIAHCKCGGFSAFTGKKHCMCSKPQWRHFNRPNLDCLFSWTIVGTKSAENDHPMGNGGRREFLTAAIFATHRESDQLGRGSLPYSIQFMMPFSTHSHLHWISTPGSDLWPKIANRRKVSIAEISWRRWSLPERRNSSGARF